MKKLILIIFILLFLIGCGTVDCSKCPTVVKTKIVVPTIACYQPESYEEFQKTLLSAEGVESEGKLFEIISVNVKMMERHIKLWEGYRDCVNKILKVYQDELSSAATSSSTKENK